MTPVGMYSDSEITSRHNFNRQLHAHQHKVGGGSGGVGGGGGGVYRYSSGPGGAPSRGGGSRIAASMGLSSMMSPDKEGMEYGAGMESDGSETSSVSKFSITSAFSTQSERPRGSRTLRYVCRIFLLTVLFLKLKPYTRH